MKITYYFFLDTYPDSPDYMKPRSVHRMRRDESGAYPERWNGKEWEVNNNLIAAWGIGGDNDYYETTESEAMRFIIERRRIIPLTPEGAALRVTDSLRFTITYDEINFVDGVLQSLELLRNEGYEVYDDKLVNYFNSKESGYRGYNTVLQDKSGNKIEIQYHTKESFRIKELIHKDYEAFRIENNPETREALLQKMEGAWKDFTPPNNYTKLPGVMKP